MPTKKADKPTEETPKDQPQEQTTESVKADYFFPEHGVTVQAESLEQAHKLVAKQVNK